MPVGASDPFSNPSTLLLAPARVGQQGNRIENGDDGPISNPSTLPLAPARLGQQGNGFEMDIQPDAVTIKSRIEAPQQELSDLNKTEQEDVILIGFLDTVSDLEQKRSSVLNNVASADDEFQKFEQELILKDLDAKIAEAIEILERRSSLLKEQRELQQGREQRKLQMQQQKSEPSEQQQSEPSEQQTRKVKLSRDAIRMINETAERLNRAIADFRGARLRPRT